MCWGHFARGSRATPPSLRFLGPKVYIAALVVLIAILRHGATALRMRELTEVIGVDRRTVERWRTWWRDSFTATPFWKVARAAFMPPVDPGQLPAALIERFAGDAADRLVALLRFMGPITGGRVHAPAARSPRCSPTCASCSAGMTLPCSSSITPRRAVAASAPVRRCAAPRSSTPGAIPTSTCAATAMISRCRSSIVPRHR